MDITRKGVHYYKNGTKVNNETLDRIKKLRIPPAWTNVNIANSECDYLQVTGKDEKGKTQYIYHPLWVELSKNDKYQRLANFNQKLPLLNNHVNLILKKGVKLDDREYLLCLLFKILSKTYIRVGNECYANENKTYGLTTLLKKHLSIQNNQINFSFVGKKGVKQNISFYDHDCLKGLKELRKLPGEHLFQTSDGVSIKSIEMNDYLKNIMGEDFTCKDFRTYASNLLFIEKLCNVYDESLISKKLINQLYDEVAQQLGHTRTISKKSYIMSNISEIFMNDPKKFIGKDPNKVLKKILDQNL